jgi:heat shock protein HtpX
MYKWIQSSKWENTTKSVLLLVSFPIILYFMFLIILLFIWWTNNISEVLYEANQFFLPIVVIVWIWSIISFIFYKEIVFSFSWAKPITRKENPEIYNIVENLCISRWLPTPNIGIIEDESMNAFATWWQPKKSWIVFSRWILNRLDKKEIEAVAAHELTHIMNKDTMLMLIIVVVIWAIATIWEILLRIWLNSSDSNEKNNSKWPLILSWIILLIAWYIFFPLIRL